MKTNTPKLRFKEFTDDWQEKKLGDVAEFFKGVGISKEETSENGENECIRYGELYTHYSELIKEIRSKTNLNLNRLFKSQYNDVIIPASGETNIDIATASCVMKDGVALGGDLNIIRTKQNGIFLSYYLNNAKRNNIARLAQGNSVVHLYSSQLKNLSLNLPSSEEQEKIAGFLTAVDEKINKLEEKKKGFEKYKNGAMQAIFSQKIRFKKPDGSNYPDWAEKKLGEFASFYKGSGISKEETDENGMTECIRYGELYTAYNEIIKNIKSRTSITPSNLFLSQFNDVIIPASGEINIDIATASCVLKNGVALGGDLNVIRAKANGIFLSYYLNNFKKFDIAKLAQGNSVVHLYLSQLKNLIVDLPCAEEQEKIAEFLTSLGNKVDLINKQLEQAILFKKYLLQQMFV